MWGDITVSPVHDSSGETQYLLGQMQDITERKQAEKELQESEAQLSAILEAVPTMILLLDDNFHILQANRTVVEFSRRPAEEVIGLKGGDVFRCLHSLDNPKGCGHSIHCADCALRNAAKSVIATGNSIANGEAQLIVFEGETHETRDFRASMIPLFHAGQNCVLVCVEDVTDIRRMKEEVRKNQNLESLGVLAGGIAHDFNNVLTGVIGSLALLEKLVDKDSDAYKIAKESKQAANRTQDLTQQLLTFAKGGAPLKDAASIEELIRETTELSLHGSHMKPAYHLAENLHSVHIDKGQIGQVLQNLVLNADQAMPEGGMLKVSAENVELSAQDPLPLEAGDYVKVSVVDQGIGMSTEVMAKIFDPYYTTKPAGHGLGLSITHSIIQRHDGYITVRSEQNVGTTFEFYLPALQERATATREQEHIWARGTGHILLMDDEETIHRTVGRTLKLLGYEVESVYDGEDALQAYKAALETDTSFDIVIMDLTIPGAMGGQEAVGKLLEIDPQAKVLVSSGYADDPVMTHFAESGFAGQVTKPVDMQELADTVKRVLAPRVELDTEIKADIEGAKSGPYTVLLVDDDTAILNATAQLLADLGYTVLTAEEGVQAVEIYRQRHPEIDGVVLDYSLPRMNGREAFLKMREIDPDVEVLLATGYGSNEEVRQLLDIGMSGLLSKPYEIKALLQGLERLLTCPV